jgi:hypothetical protein
MDSATSFCTLKIGKMQSICFSEKRVPFHFLFRFQIKDDIKAARIQATEALTRPLATLSQRERGNSILSPSGREIERGGTLTSL